MTEEIIDENTATEAPADSVPETQDQAEAPAEEIPAPAVNVGHASDTATAEPSSDEKHTALHNLGVKLIRDAQALGVDPVVLMRSLTGTL